MISAVGRVDVLMAPIDGEEHILEYTAVAAMREALSPAWVIPMHYRIAELETNPSSPQSWIRPLTSSSRT